MQSAAVINFRVNVIEQTLPYEVHAQDPVPILFSVLNHKSQFIKNSKKDSACQTD